MSWNFGNNYSDGHQAQSYKYEPKWEKMVDYSPDRRRADGGWWIEDKGKDALELMHVRGFGAVLTRLRFDAEGRAELVSIDTFTDDEIGWRL